MENISAMLRGGSPDEYQRPDPTSERDAVRAPGEQPWEMIMDKKHFKLWRRPIEGTHLYQYRGTARCAPRAASSPHPAPAAPRAPRLASAWRKKCEIPSFTSPCTRPVPSQPFGGGRSPNACLGAARREGKVGLWGVKTCVCP